MFLLVPYRAKNPPECFPCCTVGLIVANIVVFALTTQNYEVTDDALSALALSHVTFSVWRLITALFLHENLLHIGGNMLFLWIFGAAVEGRLRWAKFLAVYFTAGILGGILTDLIFGFSAPAEWNLGASGAIMGLLGAYMYMFPFSQISIFWWLLIRIGIAQWQAWWLIVFFVGNDIVSGYLTRSSDGVGHVAHLSGFASGYLMAMMFRPATDNIVASEVKSTLDEIKSIHLLSFRELEVLTRQPTGNIELILAYCCRALVEGGQKGLQKSFTMVRRYERLLVEQADPMQFGGYLLALPPVGPTLPSILFLRTGTRLEQIDETDLAAHMYRRIFDMNPDGRDAETALYRLGRLLERVYCNPESALQTHAEQLRRFPSGPLALDGQAALARLTPAAALAAANRPASPPMQPEPVAAARSGDEVPQSSPLRAARLETDLFRPSSLPAEQHGDETGEQADGPAEQRSGIPRLLEL